MVILKHCYQSGQYFEKHNPHINHRAVIMGLWKPGTRRAYAAGLRKARGRAKHWEEMPNGSYLSDPRKLLYRAGYCDAMWENNPGDRWWGRKVKAISVSNRRAFAAGYARGRRVLAGRES